MASTAAPAPQPRRTLQVQRPRRRPALAALDLRTPSGRRLPF